MSSRTCSPSQSTTSTRANSLRRYSGPQRGHCMPQGGPTDVVFHMAAQSLVRPSYRDPVDTYATNVWAPCICSRLFGRWSVRVRLSSLPATNATKTVNGIGAIERTIRWGDTTPTATRKAAPSSSPAPIGAPSLHQRCTEGARLQRARGNVIGGGDWSIDRLIPDIIRAFSRKASGNSQPARDPAMAARARSIERLHRVG